MTKRASYPVLVKIVETCKGAPDQWDAWDSDGRYWYMKFRSGIGTIGHGYSDFDVVDKFYDYGTVSISLDDFLMLMDLQYEPLDPSQPTSIVFEEKPPIPGEKLV